MNLAEFNRDGFALIPDVLDVGEVAELIVACEMLEAVNQTPVAAGRRNLLQRVPKVREVAETGRVQSLAEEVLGPRAFPVRALWFDKAVGANWKVSWHQDLAIAVAERREVPGFYGWSVKDGVPHVHPPAEILTAMVTVRLHLDDCHADNGPLRVIPGSHRHGRLGPEALAELREQGGETTCVVPVSGVLLMRPLLLHASSAANRPGHRRVLHLEYAAGPLPGGLAWFASGDPVQKETPPALQQVAFPPKRP